MHDTLYTLGYFRIRVDVARGGAAAKGAGGANSRRVARRQAHHVFFGPHILGAMRTCEPLTHN